MKSYILATALIMVSTLNAQGPAAPQTTAGGAAPAVVEPAPVNPAPVNPSPPVVQPPPVQQPPVTPQQPPANPQFGAPGQQQPYNPYGQPQQPGFFPGAFAPMDPQNLECAMGQCRNRRIVMSPGQGFTLKCTMPFQCDGLDLTLNVAFDPTNFGSQVSDINNLDFDVPTNGATIRINSIGGNNVEIDNLNCKVLGACRNLKVIGGFGVETWNMNVKCEMPGACTGCTVNGQSCEMLSMMHGNNNGFMPYGYGYTNTPNQPGMGGQPQQPGFGGYPQQPQQYPAQPMPQFNPYQPWI